MIITENLNNEFARAKSQLPQTDRRSLIRAPQSVYLPSGQMGRTAQIGGESVRLGADIRNLSPPIKDPRFNPDNFFIPHYDPSNGTTNPTLHEWIIHYYKYDPLVGNAIEIHSQLPISRFDITGVEDPAIMQVYEQMVDDINLLDNMYNFLKCWWLFGEAMPYFWWSEAYNRFVQMTFIDTSRVRVLGHHLGFSEIGDSIYHYELEPDEHLKSLVNSNDPYDREVAQYIDPAIVGAIRRGMNLELDPFSTELVCNKAVPWDLRGTSIILGIIKDLLYSDTLKNAQYAIARGHIAPKWLWKLGQAGPDGYMPTDGDLQAFRELLLQANQDPLFTIITHYAVSAEVIGASGKVLPIASELDGIDRRIMTRLFTNKALTYSEGPTYSSASVGLRVLMSRYLPIRSMMEDLFKRKLFLPVALANKFLDKDNRPIIPNFNWRHKQSLLDDSAMRSALIQLRDKGDVPLKVLADGMELDYEELLHWLDEEQGTIADRTMYRGKESAIQKMIQGAKDGIAGLLESFRSLRLPKDKAEGESQDEGKSVPDGYDPEAIDDVKPPTEPSTGAPALPVSKSPTDKPQAPLGGEAGEKTTQSFRQFKDRKRATKPLRYQSMRAKATYTTMKDIAPIPLNEWQERLLTTRIDKSSQQTIIDTEVNVLNSFESAKDLFVQRLLTTWKEKGSIQDKDLSHAVRDTVDIVNTESSAGFGEQLSTLYEGAQTVAVEQLVRSKKGRRYVSQRRAALSDDRRRQITDAVNKAFSKINTVSDDMLEKMRTKLHDNVDDIPSNIVNQLFAEVDAEGLGSLTDEEVQDRLGELWNQQRYIYERIIRTETMNIYVTGGLQEWSDAGYKKAVRREMNDNKVCAYCRTVDGKEYDIGKLLKLDYPLIQNPDTGEYEGHPYCRGSFSPIVSFSEFDEYIPPPEVAFDDVEPVLVGDTEINGVPTVMADQIESALEQNDLSAVVNVVPDVVDTLAWVDAERQKILQDELGQGRQAPSGMRLDLMVNESQEANRGAVSLFETDTGETLVSGFSFFGNEPEWFILRQRGKQDYLELPTDLIDTIDEMYAMKLAESEMTIDDDGIEIIGIPAGGRAVGFITPTASQDAENYFIESFSFYQTDPYKLEFLDPLMYAFLRDSVYNGVQFKHDVSNPEE